MRTAASALLILMIAAGCGGTKPKPSVPLADCKGLCGDGPLYAVDTVQLEMPDAAGVCQGFNLSGSGPNICGTEPFVGPDGKADVDNQLARVYPILAGQIGSALPTDIQNSVNTGGLLLLIEIVGDPTTDTKVQLVMHAAAGTPLLGGDGLLLADQTYALKNEPPLGVCENATVSNGRISCGPFDLLIQIAVFGVPYQITFRSGLITMTLPTDGSDSQILFGASIEVADIMSLAEGIQNGPANLLGILQSTLPPLADIQDPKTGVCDRISGVLGMTARTAFAVLPSATGK